MSASRVDRARARSSSRHDRGDAAGRVEVLHVVARSPGEMRTRFGVRARDRRPVVERDVGVGLVRDGGEVQHRVARAAERHVERHRVADARRRS